MFLRVHEAIHALGLECLCTGATEKVGSMDGEAWNGARPEKPRHSGEHHRQRRLSLIPLDNRHHPQDDFCFLFHFPFGFPISSTKLARARDGWLAGHVIPTVSMKRLSGKLQS